MLLTLVVDMCSGGMPSLLRDVRFPYTALKSRHSLSLVTKLCEVGRRDAAS